MNNYYGIGRVNTNGKNYFHNNNNCIINTENGDNIISRTYGSNELTALYFSNNNRELLQDQIKKYIYFNTESNYIIGSQNDDELKIIMKGIYLSNRQKLSFNINVYEQVKFLNKLVILECSKIIKTNLLQHIHYVKELNKKPIYQNLPLNVSNKGIRNLEMYK